MDRTAINQKSWYRALKVLFIILFVITQILGIGIAYIVSNETTSFIHCDNGKEFENTYFYADDQDKLAIYKKCDITAFLLSKSEVKGVLSDAQMKDLGNQISQMQNSGALQVDMQSAVDSFKEQYADRTPSASLAKSYTTEEFTKLIGHDPADSFTVAGSDNKWIANFTFENKDIYSLAIKIIYYLVSVILISIIFWLISRVFFYIVAKDKFFRLK